MEGWQERGKRMKRSIQLLGIIAGLFLLYCVMFFLPGAVDRFSLEYTAVMNGEWWRFFSYQLVHGNVQHLLFNLVGVALLWTVFAEVDVLSKEALGIYFLAGVVAALPIWFATKITVLGASTAVYAGFGVASMHVRKFEVNEGVVLAVVAGLAVVSPLFLLVAGGVSPLFFSASSSALLHMSGLFFGALAHRVWETKDAFPGRKRYLLREVVLDD
ncbi:rhomboid family intramembrane serine protease [Candidatus Woesearchaeota archaeon]|nr:MAG: rhomboid family intramembrane serine protease [Candidatus Woesearchaeota archaeon]